MKKHDPPPIRLFGISAEPGNGKTTAIMELAKILKEKRADFTGVAQPAVVESRGSRHIVWGYRLLDLVTGESRPFARRIETGDGSGKGFRLDEEGIEWAAARIGRQAKILLADEMGWAEAEGGGHWPAVMEALGSGNITAAVFTFRPALRSAFARMLEPLCSGGSIVWRIAPGKAPEERWSRILLENHEC